MTQTFANHFPVGISEIEKKPAPKVNLEVLFDRMISRPIAIPDSIFHGLRLIGSVDNCVNHLATDNEKILSSLPNGLDDTACAIVNLFTAPILFEVYDYAMYPELAITNQQKGHEVAFQNMLQRVKSNTSSYLLIGKQIWPGQGGVPFLGVSQITFKVALDLPRDGAFSKVNELVIDLIQNEVQTAIDSKFNELGGGISSINEAEIAGLSKFREIVSAIINNTYPIGMTEEFLKSAGFVEAPCPSLPVWEHTNNVYIGTSARDYAGLRAPGGDLVGEMAESGFSQGAYGITTGVVISDNLTYSNGVGSSNLFNQAATAYKTLLNKKINVWFHFWNPATGPQKLYFKTDSQNLSEEEADNVLKLAYAEYRNGIYGGNPPLAKSNPQKKTLQNCPDLSGLGIDWRLHPHMTDCLEDMIDQNWPDCPAPGTSYITFGFYGSIWNSPLCWLGNREQAKFVGGFACGFYDGILDIIGGICHLAKGLYEVSSHDPRTSIYWMEVVKDIVKERSFWKGIEHKLTDDGKFYIKAYDTLKKILCLLNPVKLIELIYNMFNCAIKLLKSWYGDLTLKHGTVMQGYRVGNLAFQVILIFLTDGASAAAGSEALDAGLINAEKLDRFISAAGKADVYELEAIAEEAAASESKAAEIKNFVKTECSEANCFTGNTLVSTFGGKIRMDSISN